MDVFHVFSNIVSSQRVTDELHEAITNHIGHIKELTAEIQHLEGELRSHREGDAGSIRGICEVADAPVLSFTSHPDLSPVVVPRSSVLTVLEETVSSGDTVTLTVRM
ncbi:hypothetical protein ERJ75_000190500 [Trypanosoma vivax]|nr:hypothetical protein ERJ75_000190500 [Trypanosoma vivax]